MELSTCRRRASDVEQSSRWTYSATAECEPAMVKEEPEWGECGESEAAVAEGFSADHAIKVEIEIEPEVTQLQPQDSVFSMQDLHIKTESCDKPESAGGAGPRRGGGSRQHGLGRCRVLLRRLPVEEPASCPSRLRGELLSPRSTVQQHARLSSDRACGCDMCGKCLIQKSALVEHMDKKLDSCKMFTAAATVTSHKATQLCKKLYTCDVCNKRFPQKYRLTEHLQIHTDVKPHNCNVCNKTYRKKSNLTRHVRTHTSDTPYKCNVCQKRFISKGKLTSHTVTHTGVKPFRCDVCKKQFVEKCRLTEHLRMHTGEIRYSCDVCSKQFSCSWHLTSHMRIHTGEKPYSCDMCNKKFNEKSNLTRHVRTHTGNKPYSCDVCYKKFSEKSNLTRHVRTHRQ